MSGRVARSGDTIVWAVVDAITERPSGETVTVTLGAEVSRDSHSVAFSTDQGPLLFLREMADLGVVRSVPRGPRRARRALESRWGCSRSDALERAILDVTAAT